MTAKFKPLAVATAFGIGLGITGAPAQITEGFDFLVDAGVDDDGDGVWEDTVAGNPSGLSLALDAAVTRVALSGDNSTATQLTHAYDFPGGLTGNVGGAELAFTDGLGGASWQDAPGSWDNQDFSLEIWFKPDNLDPTPGNGQIIFEDGGGSGLGLFVDDNELVCSQDNNDTVISYNLVDDPLGLLIGATATDDFMQAVITRVRDTGETILYLNGIEVGTGNDNPGDFSGGDDAAFGTRGASNTGGRGGGQSDTESFDGQMALIRAYQDQILTPTEVLANFEELSGPDLVAPTIGTVDPADDSTGVYPGTILVATFSEDVALTGSGTITVTDTADGTGTFTITLPDGSVSVSGSDLTIVPTASLEFDTAYEVTIDGAAVEDLADIPNAFAGTASGQWTFTTAAQDLTAPLAQSYSPQAPTEGTITDNLVLTLDDPVVAGTGNINIRDITDPLNPVVTTIPATDTSQITIDGTVVTIDPAVALNGGANYAVQIDSGAFENYSGVAYAGIADDSTWAFTTLEALLIYEPFNDLDPTLAGNTPGLGLDGTWNGASLVEDGSLQYGALAYEGGRAVSNPGNNFDQCTVSPGTTLTDAGLMADGATLWFSALIVNYNPSETDNRTYVALGTGGADGFDRIGGDTGSGFTVAVSKNSAGGVTAQAWNDGSDGAGGATRGATVPVADNATFLAVGKITWGEFGVTPDVFDLYLPTEDLTLGDPVSTIEADFDQLGVVNPANAFATISFAGGRPPSGVPEVDELRFGAAYEAVAPVDTTAPVLVSTDPADESPSGSTVQLVATFNEPIMVGAGDIRIVNDTDSATTTIPIGDPQIVVSGSTLTITPTVQLLVGKQYHIEIDAGAVTNFGGVAYAGISDPTEWNFTSDATPPKVVSIDDNVSPLPLLVNTGLTYTVTFDEAIDAASVDTADFGNGGSATITVDSVTATADPAVFEVAVSATSTGALTLEIVQEAGITDISGNALDSSSAIPDDTTIAVNDPIATAAGIVVDFQATIASEQHPDYAGEARYYHVSVNPSNPGTGSYAATIVGTNNPAGPFVRNYLGDVVGYSFAGAANDDITAISASGGEAERFTYSTEDTIFDRFGQQQAKIWDATDPGADIATGGTDPYLASSDKNGGGWRALGGAVCTVDISGLESGSLHIYYGAFNDTPSVKVTLKDTDNLAADIVIADAHSIADGGNGDSANRTEYYLAEIDFVTDGVYDIIEYEWLANGVDYTGNGRGIGTVLTGPEPVDDYTAWSELYPEADLGDPAADLDGDGLSNDTERLFGLDPTDPASNNPITVGLDPAAGTLSFTRRDDALTGRFSKVETSTDLVMWTEDTGATLTPGDPVDGIETVAVELSAGLLSAPKLFVRVVQDDGTIYAENFEESDGGFAPSGTPNDWAYGTPNSDNGFGLVLTTGNGGSANCWGTVLGTGGTVGPFGGITTGVNSILQGPDAGGTGIDLTNAESAQLQFAAALDAATNDTVEVLVKEVGTGNVLVTVPFSENPLTGDVASDWASYGPFDISDAAGKNVYLEFRFVGGVENYLGLYIDDISINRVAP